MKIAFNPDGSTAYVCEDGADTEQLISIMTNHLPQIMNKFAQKNASYGHNEFELGAAGQFPEVWRKVKLLREMLWEERHANMARFMETPEGVIDDLIGHLLMLRECIKPGNIGEKGAQAALVAGFRPRPVQDRPQA